MVEPVFGVLTLFMGLRKVYTKEIRNANKQMLMAAAAYNLKKLLKHAKTPPKSVANSQKLGERRGRKQTLSYKVFLGRMAFLKMELIKW